METLTTRDVADLLFAARERIDFYWNFYIVVVIAVIGWLVSNRRAMTVPMKALVTIGYVIASAMNALALWGAYTFAEALRSDLLRMLAAAPLDETRLILEQHSFLAQRLLAAIVHLVIGATILFVVWFARLDSAPTEENRG